MSFKNSLDGIIYRLMILPLVIFFFLICILSCGDSQTRKKGVSGESESAIANEIHDESLCENAILVSPETPAPGEGFRILVTGGTNIRKAKLIIRGPSGDMESLNSRNGEEFPYWRIDDFTGGSEGNYIATLIAGKKEVSRLEFTIAPKEAATATGVIWKTRRGWDSGTEVLYSAWVNALFQGCDEQSSWSALHEVTENQSRNFLFNYLSLGEDDPGGKNKVIMQPDCADNPFFLRAYFAWKLGLPFGYHVCDRGYLGRNPQAGQWVTNETTSSKNNPVLAFNAFLRRVMDGVHSGTARTALNNEISDYYPVSLDRQTLRPGTVYADPYGHTLIIIGWVPQTKNNPGLLLAVDAQPDGTVAIKRFWKGNFLFNTSEVVGEPGFKAFRPIEMRNGKPWSLRNTELTDSSGFIPYSLQQKNMESELFYHTMERLINPKPLDPEAAMLNLIQALHEQLIVRVTSVANGESYFKSHPGTVIPMPTRAAGVFQAGGQWENFSTPNRDLRLLIAMDAVLGFPDLVAKSPDDFDISGMGSPDKVREKLQSLLNQKAARLSITYTRSNGVTQELTMSEILKRRDAFEMAYNPNDGIEIRWGAPEKSEERSSCRRHAPANQLATMQSVRLWFQKRLHPPT